MNLAPDTVLLDRYRLEERLGGGGLASVWRATDRQRGAGVALKLLAPDAAANERRRQRFLAGARVMAALDAPAVARVYDVHDGPAGPFFASELLPGGDLRGLLPDPPLSAVTAALTSAAEGLEAAHRAGVLHRDIKPTNLLLDRDGAVRITDFDLVRPEDAPTGAPMGSFAYAAPEQLAQPGRVGPATDVYSLAMTGLYLLHGGTLPPFAFTEPAAFIASLSLPPALTEVLDRATRWDPAERHPTAAAFAQALTEAAPPQPAALATHRARLAAAAKAPAAPPPPEVAPSSAVPPAPAPRPLDPAIERAPEPAPPRRRGLVPALRVLRRKRGGDEWRPSRVLVVSMLLSSGILGGLVIYALTR